MTPLHLACKRNTIEIAKLLIDKGVDINAKAIDNKDTERSEGKVEPKVDV